jgi:predicted membrane chloride channel (bestrophin family)
MNHHQQCSNSIVRTSGTFFRVLFRWPGQVVYTPGVYSFLFCVASVLILLFKSLHTLSSGDFITLSGGGVADES